MKGEDKMRIICDICGTPANVKTVALARYKDKLAVFAVCRNRNCENNGQQYRIGFVKTQYIEC
tara:strand:- start:89 stop:277 length:189 start_codon:yes stop_codon:yes gene_type:complete